MSNTIDVTDFSFYLRDVIGLIDNSIEKIQVIMNFDGNEVIIESHLITARQNIRKIILLTDYCRESYNVFKRNIAGAPIDDLMYELSGVQSDLYHKEMVDSICINTLEYVKSFYQKELSTIGNFHYHDDDDDESNQGC